MAARDATAIPLLRTKLQAPGRRGHHVHRPGAVGLLRQGAGRALTLVDAPAGFGKTTLVADWRAGGPGARSTAWVTLDDADGDPERFWAYVLAAIAETDPRLSIPLALSGRGALHSVVPALVDALDVADRPITLVLDDYHRLDGDEVHQHVDYLLANLPPTLRLVIVTRCDPPLALGRLRSEHSLSEVRADDLRFSVDEAQTLLNARLGLSIARDDVARLVERTEGWVAGLSLAALSLRDRHDKAAFMRAFTGTDRHVVDYLGSEVLSRLPGEQRSFLVRTSMLEPLSGPLCDAVLERHGSTETLRLLERSNAFVVSLDTTREWYRYHQLFAELLRAELALEDTALVADLHRRASRWFRARGSIVEAIDHAVAAGDVAYVPDLIAPAFLRLIETGHVGTVARWLRLLREDAVAADPRLCLAAATVAVVQGAGDDVRHWVGLAKAGTWVGPLPGGPASIDAWVATIEGAYTDRHLDRTLAAARRAVALVGDDRSLWGGLAACELGVALYRAGGDDPEARRWLEVALRCGGPLTETRAGAALALMALDAGDRAAGEALARTAIGVARRHGLERCPRAALARIALGRAVAARGAAAAASAELEAAVELARRAPDRAELAQALAALAGVRRASGVGEEADLLEAEARSILDRFSDRGRLARCLDASGAPSAGADEPARAAALSGRELEVLEMLPSELTEPEIADELFISHHTVHSHTRAIYRKLDVSSRAQAVQRARVLGLLTRRAALAR